MSQLKDTLDEIVNPETEYYLEAVSNCLYLDKFFGTKRPMDPLCTSPLPATAVAGPEFPIGVIYCWPISPGKCMKMKVIGRGEGEVHITGIPPLNPPNLLGLIQKLA